MLFWARVQDECVLCATLYMFILTETETQSTTGLVTITSKAKCNVCWDVDPWYISKSYVGALYHGDFCYITLYSRSHHDKVLALVNVDWI